MEEKMGSKFVEGRSVEFSKSYKESSPSTPIFFILSPGVDPLKDVEALGKYSRRSGPPWKRNIKPQWERDPKPPWAPLNQNQKLTGALLGWRNSTPTSGMRSGQRGGHSAPRVATASSSLRLGLSLKAQEGGPPASLRPEL